MSQDFKKGLPLVDGHGNFGNIEGDGAAAMRYTEARLEQVTQEAFYRIWIKMWVDFVPNFDGNGKEPGVLLLNSPISLLTVQRELQLVWRPAYRLITWLK